jgi:putative holliday junction resolvase
MPRWLAIDYGTRRIGLALCDPDETIASPAGALAGAGNVRADAANVRARAAEHAVAGFVVGLPLNMDGTDSAQTALSRRFAAALAELGAAPVELWDERLSSFQADELLDAAGLRGAKRRARRDALAALVILQGFLDARRRGK